MDDPVTNAVHYMHTTETLKIIGLVPPISCFCLAQSRSIRFAILSAPIAAVFLLGPLRPPQPLAV